MIWDSELTLEENLLLLFSRVWLFETHGLLHTRFPVLHYFPEFAQTHVHWVSDAIQLSHPLLPPSPPALNLSQHQGLCRWAGSSHQVAKVFEFFTSGINPSNEYSGLISFRIDWFDLSAVQGTLRSLHQHHSSKISVLWHSAFFIINSCIHTWLLEKPYLWLYRPLSAK